MQKLQPHDVMPRYIITFFESNIKSLMNFYKIFKMKFNMSIRNPKDTKFNNNFI